MDGLFGQSQVVYVGQSLVTFNGSVILTSEKKRSPCLFLIALKKALCPPLSSQENRFWQQYQE